MNDKQAYESALEQEKKRRIYGPLIVSWPKGTVWDGCTSLSNRTQSLRETGKRS